MSTRGYTSLLALALALAAAPRTALPGPPGTFDAKTGWAGWTGWSLPTELPTAFVAMMNCFGYLARLPVETANEAHAIHVTLGREVTLYCPSPVDAPDAFNAIAGHFATSMLPSNWTITYHLPSGRHQVTSFGDENGLLPSPSRWLGDPANLPAAGKVLAVWAAYYSPTGEHAVIDVTKLREAPSEAVRAACGLPPASVVAPIAPISPRSSRVAPSP